MLVLPHQLEDLRCYSSFARFLVIPVMTATHCFLPKTVKVSRQWIQPGYYNIPQCVWTFFDGLMCSGRDVLSYNMSASTVADVIQVELALMCFRLKVFD